MIIILEMLCTGIIKINIHIIMHKKMLVAAVVVAVADVVVDAVDAASDAAVVVADASDALAALIAGAGGSFNILA